MTIKHLHEGKYADTGCDGTCDFCKEIRLINKLVKLRNRTKGKYLRNTLSQTIKVIENLWQKSEDLEYEAFLAPCHHCGENRIKDE